MGFQPIQGDYFEKPTGLTAEDLLKWDGSALARLAKGSNGQFLGVNGSGALAYINAGAELEFIRYGYTPFSFEYLNTEVVNDPTETSTTSTSLTNYYTLNLNESLNANCVTGYNYSVRIDLEAKHNGAAAANNFSFEGNPTVLQTLNNLTYTPASQVLINLQYNTNYLQQYKASSGYSIYKKNYIITLVGKYIQFPSVIDSSIMTAKSYAGVRNIELYDSGDSVKINDDSTLIFTGVTGQPTGLNLSSGGKSINPEDITQIEVVSGNPLIVFEKA